MKFHVGQRRLSIDSIDSLLETTFGAVWPVTSVASMQVFLESYFLLADVEASVNGRSTFRVLMPQKQRRIYVIVQLKSRQLHVTSSFSVVSRNEICDGCKTLDKQLKNCTCKMSNCLQAVSDRYHDIDNSSALKINGSSMCRPADWILSVLLDVTDFIAMVIRKVAVDPSLRTSTSNVP